MFEDFQIIDAEIIEDGICEEEYEVTMMIPEVPPPPAQPSVTSSDLCNINKIKPMNVKLVNCDKYPWYYAKYEKPKLEAKYLNTVKDGTNSCKAGSNKSSISVDSNKISECSVIVIDDEDEDSNVNEDMPESTFNRLEQTNSKKKTAEKNRDYNNYKSRNDKEIPKAKSQNNSTGLNRIDFKRNIGLVGLKIQRMIVNDKAKECDVLKGNATNSTKKSPKKLVSKYIKAVDKTLGNTGTTITTGLDRNQIQNRTKEAQKYQKKQSGTLSMDYPEKYIGLKCGQNISSPNILDGNKKYKLTEKDIEVKEQCQNILSNMMQNVDRSKDNEIIVNPETIASNPVGYPTPISSQCKVDEKVSKDDNNMNEFFENKITQPKSTLKSKKIEEAIKCIKRNNDTNLLNQPNKNIDKYEMIDLTCSNPKINMNNDFKENSKIIINGILCASNKYFTDTNKFTQKVLNIITEKNPKMAGKISKKKNTKNKIKNSDVSVQLVSVEENRSKSDKQKVKPKPPVSVEAIMDNNLSTNVNFGNIIVENNNDVIVSNSKKDILINAVRNQNSDKNNYKNSFCPDSFKDNLNKQKTNHVACSVNDNSTAAVKISKIQSASIGSNSSSHKKSKKLDKLYPEPPFRQYIQLHKEARPRQINSKRKKPVKAMSKDIKIDIDNYLKNHGNSNSLISEPTQNQPTQRAQQNCLENIQDYNDNNKKTVQQMVFKPPQGALKPHLNTFQSVRNIENTREVNKTHNKTSKPHHDSNTNNIDSYRMNTKIVQSMTLKKPQQPPKSKQDQFPKQIIVTGSDQQNNNKKGKEQTLNILKITNHTPQNTETSSFVIRPRVSNVMSSAPIITESMQPLVGNRPDLMANIPKPLMTQPILPKTLLTKRHQLPLQQVSPVRRNLYHRHYYSFPIHEGPQRMPRNVANFHPERNNCMGNNFMNPPAYTGQNCPQMPSNANDPLVNYDLNPANIYWPYNYLFTLVPPPPLPPPPPPPPQDLPKQDKSIIGINTNGFIKKISIFAPATRSTDIEIDCKLKVKQELTSTYEELTPDSTPVSSKTEMMAELEKAVLIESPMKNDFKKTIPFENSLDQTKYRYEPVSSKTELMVQLEKPVTTENSIKQCSKRSYLYKKSVDHAKHSNKLKPEPVLFQEEPEKAARDENSVKTNYKRSYEISDVQARHVLVNEVNDYRPGSLSKKLKFNDNVTSPPRNRNHALSYKGYSPPILPILTD